MNPQVQDVRHFDRLDESTEVVSCEYIVTSTYELWMGGGGRGDLDRVIIKISYQMQWLRELYHFH